MKVDLLLTVLTNPLSVQWYQCMPRETGDTNLFTNATLVWCHHVSHSISISNLFWALILLPDI
jgi:hypothetical protein